MRFQAGGKELICYFIKDMKEIPATPHGENAVLMLTNRPKPSFLQVFPPISAPPGTQISCGNHTFSTFLETSSSSGCAAEAATSGYCYPSAGPANLVRGALRGGGGLKFFGRRAVFPDNLLGGTLGITLKSGICL